VKTVSDKVVGHSLAYLSVHNSWRGRPLWPKLTHPLAKRRCSINFRS